MKRKYIAINGNTPTKEFTHTVTCYYTIIILLLSLAMCKVAATTEELALAIIFDFIRHTSSYSYSYVWNI